MRFYPLLPLWLILISAAAGTVLILLSARHARAEGRSHVSLLTGLRLGSLFLLTILLLSPGVTLTERESSRSALVWFLDASDSMSVTDMPYGESRFDFARNTLEKLLSRRDSRVRNYIYFFNHEVRPADDPDKRSFAGCGGNTDLKKAWQTAERDIGSRAISGAVVLTDGLDHSGFAGPSGDTPLYAVQTGTDLSGVPDLRIDHFVFPESVRPGEIWEAEIPLTLAGTAKPLETELRIADGKRSLLRKKVRLEPGKTQKISFRTVFSSPGLHALQLSAGKMKGEISPLNNSREIFIEVREESVVPFLYFPVLTNSFRPVIRLFEKSGRPFTALCRLRSGNTLVRGNTPLAGRLKTFPGEASILKKVNLLFLGSGAEGDYTDGEIAVIEKYVSEGGTVLIYGGPGAFVPGRNRLFSALLPLYSVPGGFSGGTSRIKGTPGETLFRDFLKYQPSVSGINQAVSLKPNTQVLLTAGEDGSLPLFVSMPYGRGRCTAFLGNSLHTAVSSSRRNECFRSFWADLLTYAAEGNGETVQVAVPSSLRTGEPLTVRVSAPDALSVRAELTENGKEQKTLSKLSGLFEGSFRNLRKGRNVVKVTVLRKDAPPVVRYRACWCGEASSENDDLRSLPELFLKFTTSGRIFRPSQLEKLEEVLDRGPEGEKSRREYRFIFENPVLLILLAVLLSAEWFLRRKYDLF